MQLVAGDLLGLGPLGGLEVHDRGLVGVQAADEVDPAVHRDARGDPYLYLLLAVQGLPEDSPVLGEVAADGLAGGVAELLPQRRIGERDVQVPVDQVRDLGGRGQITVDGPLVDFRHDVVDGLAVAERLMDRRVESIEET